MSDRIDKSKDRTGKWLMIELLTPVELIEAVSNFMTEIGTQGVFQEVPEPAGTNGLTASIARESLKAYLPYDLRIDLRLASLRTYLESLSQLFPDIEKVDFKTEIIIDPDWAEQWKKYFKPLRISKNIVIKPTWERYAPLGRDIVVEIDPGMAFGTGQHASTRICLEAVEEILLKDRSFGMWRVLDVGTGTGILGISCAKLGAQRVVCVDIDKKAAEIARENVFINGVQDRVEIINRDVTTIREPFDLIVANLTSKLLLKLRDHLTSLTDGQGYLVISGIIEQNRSDIEEHFLSDAFITRNIITEKEWICYALQKKGA
ncbi:MAG: 50S ribosomal protein L11 methyltransferase [Deltaproteobacteria bacterium]|nr:50S ribosomal protein L11 methyltransferase [Deltaproteobacteria bacterium]